MAAHTLLMPPLPWMLLLLLLCQARLALDVDQAATRLVVLKLHYPGADLTRIIQRQPHMLLLDIPTLEDNAKQVRAPYLQAERQRHSWLMQLTPTGAQNLQPPAAV